MMNMRSLPFGAGLLAIVWMADSPAAEFCVDDADALQGILDTAASNGQDDHIKLVQGNYPAPPGGWTFTSIEGRELKLSGGWVGICLGRSSNVFSTVLNGNGLDRALDIAAGPAGTVKIEQIEFLNGNAGIGGAILISNTGETLLERNAFIGNRASSSGSAVYVFDGDRHRFLNNLFIENEGSNVVDAAQVGGEGVYFIGNTVADNFASDHAAVSIAMSGGASVLVANNILWGNDGNDLDLASTTGDVFYWNNNVADYIGPAVGVDNLSVDPGFAPALGIYELLPSSPLIDMGIEPPDTLPIPAPFEDNWWLGTADLWGNERVAGLTVDLGAFELPDVLFINSFDGE